MAEPGHTNVPRWITYDELRHCTASHAEPPHPTKPTVLRAMTGVLQDLKAKHWMAGFLDTASVVDLMAVVETSCRVDRSWHEPCETQN